ncbi:hypothetical protein Nepgr_004308 [Nepenthes gracilis]|uniref:non-specific serine/threonine protein kinase n=1 Tax=Nepenthes gracilis TaxID=150966 RepID=A0AAD3S1D7_NEPGR|nr:hypothetical protein Nepgr_004308 [Nepenthes gracilis]
MKDEDDNKQFTTTASINPFLLLLLTSTFSLSSGDDASVMFKLAESLIPTPSGWSGSEPCKWDGVGCDSTGRVTTINLSYKMVGGNLPSEIAQLSNLKSLSVQKNKLSGLIPSLSNLSNLQEVFLNDNSFSALPSSFLEGLHNLLTFSISNNPLSPWRIPETLSELISLQDFRAYNAGIHGQIPDIFQTLPSLQDLKLSYNNLTGPLPRSLAGSAIQNLLINNQKTGLSGTLDVLSEMSDLAQAWLHDNAFTGPIPDLSKCTSLFDLQLRENQLTGIVPASLTILPSLLNVSLQNNMLQGPMPMFKTGVQASLGTTNSFCNPKPGPCDPEVTVLLAIVAALGYPKELAESWKGNDACSGWSHVTCDAEGKSVTAINFAKQGWSGMISPAFANVTSLTTIILSDNHLYGKIPDSLTSLTHLQRLDVSNNNLTGQIPSFSSSVMVKTAGNPFLGTNVSTGPSPLGSPSSPPISQSPGESKSNSKSSSPSPIAITVIILVHGEGFNPQHSSKKAIGKMKSAKKNQINAYGWDVDNPNTTPKSTIAFSDGGSAVIPIEVLQEATNNFSDSAILGRGGFGVVYKGILPDGTQIAVKRMESNVIGTKGLAEFQAEIAVLTKVSHKHLVALLGYCVNGHERMVIYEYMPQGTLGQHLFEWKETGLLPLVWRQRLVIALDVARGVEYLHSLAQKNFIHRDLKPSNILLGVDMRAKVSDFGLVKNAPEGKYSVETRLAGTFGYLAPEYAATGRVNRKVDVFAFGVILMEMITGRRALDESLPDEQAHLVPWLRRVIISKENLRKSIDPFLEPDEEMYTSISRVAELAVHCTAREPSQRPDMGHLVNILLPLVEQWTPTLPDGDNSIDTDFDINLPDVVQRWQAGETSSMNAHTRSSQVHLSSPTTSPKLCNDSFNEGR